MPNPTLFYLKPNVASGSDGNRLYSSVHLLTLSSPASQFCTDTGGGRLKGFNVEEVQGLRIVHCPDNRSFFSGGFGKLSLLVLLFRIVYDRESGQSRGFGFVTFTNPRAAAKAINGLDGGVLGGRTIRVNEVKKNSGKTLNRDASFRDRGEKDRERRESRDRDRTTGRGRNFSPQRNRRSNRGRSPPLSPGPGRSARTRSPARSPSFNSSSAGRARAPSSRTSQSPQSSDRVHGEESTHKTSAMSTRIAKEKQTDVIKVREELDRAVQSRQELEDKVSNLTSAVDQAKETVAALQSGSQQLEESLVKAQATSSHRQLQLRKLQKGILQVKDSAERLKSHEKELKILMLATMSDLEVIDMDIEDRLGTIGNGGHYNADKNVDDIP